jgi:hypothetical protein
VEDHRAVAVSLPILVAVVGDVDQVRLGQVIVVVLRPISDPPAASRHLAPFQTDHLTPLLKSKYFLALFRKNLCPPTQVNVDRRRNIFASALPLQTLQLVHSAIKLPVQVRLVANELVGGIRRRQTEASDLRVYCQVLSIQRILLERGNPFQLMLNKSDDISVLCFNLLVPALFGC